MVQKKIKNSVIYLLSLKSRSTRELKEKLSLKGFSEEEISKALEDCLSYGWIDDDQESLRRFATLKRKGYGPFVIQGKLKQAGLESPLMSQEEQIQLIQEFASKPKWKGVEKPKLVAALMRRGFEGGSIFKALQLSEDEL